MRCRDRRERRGAVREELVEAVLRVVEEIPPGRVATYGMIARARWGPVRALLGGSCMIGVVVSRGGAS